MIISEGKKNPLLTGIANKFGKLNRKDGFPNHKKDASQLKDSFSKIEF